MMPPKKALSMKHPDSCKILFFQMDFLSKKIDFHSILLTSPFMPTPTFFLFQQCCHPTILAVTLPCLMKWSFDEGNQVFISLTSKLGVIETIWVEID